MRFDTAEDFRIFVIELLQTQEFEEQLKRFSRTRPNSMVQFKENWDWLEYDKLYLVSNSQYRERGEIQPRNLFIIYYPSPPIVGTLYKTRVVASLGRLATTEDNLLFWVGIASSMENVGYWDIDKHNDGKSWVTAFVKLSAPAVQSFLNWNNLPWSGVK